MGQRLLQSGYRKTPDNSVLYGGSSYVARQRMTLAAFSIKGIDEERRNHVNEID